MSHDDHRCATDAETVYVENKVGCVMSGVSGGSAIAPYCDAQAGVDAAVSNAMTKIVIIRGSVGAWSTGGSGVKRITVVGQDSGTIVGGVGSGITLLGGEFYLRSLTVMFSMKTAVVVGSSATLRMNRCTIKRNSAGGLLVQSGAAFDVTNTVFDDNQDGFATGLGVFGGVALGAARSSGPARFRNNTVVNNRPVGVVCESSSQSVVNSILFHTTGSDVGNCVVLSSKTGDPQLGNGYHLTATSPCRDAGDSTDFAPDDIDGDRRPSGSRSDCGADEFVP